MTSNKLPQFNTDPKVSAKWREIRTNSMNVVAKAQYFDRIKKDVNKILKIDTPKKLNNSEINEIEKTVDEIMSDADDMKITNMSGIIITIVYEYWFKAKRNDERAKELKDLKEILTFKLPKS